MEVLVYTDIETLMFKEEKKPMPNEGEELIKVNSAGICGSDILTYHGLEEHLFQIDMHTYKRLFVLFLH